MSAALKEKVKDMTTTQIFNAVYIDLQTGCYNRRAFEDRDIHSGNLIVLIDVDSLKWVNDNLGHAAGDLLLQIVARKLQQVFGAQDVYRLSGDEFALTWTNTSDLMSGMHKVVKALGCISFGVGATLERADDALKVDKDARLINGERSARGERPQWWNAEWFSSKNEV